MSYAKAVAQQQPQRQEGGRQFAGDGDPPVDQPLGIAGRAGDDHRPVVVADAGTARAQGVLVGDIRVSVQADGGQLQLAREGPLVQRLDILQLVREAIRPGVDLVVRQGVKHERVVGIGAVADADQSFFGHSVSLIVFPKLRNRCSQRSP